MMPWMVMFYGRDKQCKKLKDDNDMLMSRFMDQHEEIQQLHMDKMMLTQRLERLERLASRGGLGSVRTGVLRSVSIN